MRPRVAVAIIVCLLASACGQSTDASLPTFDDAAKGERVEPDSFLDALRSSFRRGSTAEITFDIRGGASLRGRGTVRYRADEMDASLRIDDWKVQGGSIDIRTVDGTTYMRVPESRGLWVNLTDGGAGMPGADLADDADPRESIGDLRDNIAEIRFSGTETVRGARTRRFQVVTKPDKSGHPTVTEYWFDGHGRVVRRHSELAQTGSATFTWTKWGRALTIARPKQGTVISLKRLQQLREQQSGQLPG
jgi:hypothetical protein